MGVEADFCFCFAWGFGAAVFRTFGPGTRVSMILVEEWSSKLRPSVCGGTPIRLRRNEFSPQVSVPGQKSLEVWGFEVRDLGPLGVSGFKVRPSQVLQKLVEDTPAKPWSKLEAIALSSIGAWRIRLRCIPKPFISS